MPGVEPEYILPAQACSPSFQLCLHLQLMVHLQTDDRCGMLVPLRYSRHTPRHFPRVSTRLISVPTTPAKNKHSVDVWAQCTVVVEGSDPESARCPSKAM